jgi:hypothetical protein
LAPSESNKVAATHTGPIHSDVRARTNTFITGEIVSRLRRKTPAIVAKIRRRENFVGLGNNDADASVED